MQPERIRDYLTGLQQRICAALERRETEQRFLADDWTREEGGGGRTCILEGGEVFERAGVGFSHVLGDSLPAAASERRPELAGRSFQALGVSLVIHPLNPYVPTAHANVRFLTAEREDADPIWWFGGGFDLTPYYGFDDDAVHWHRVARQAVEPFGAHLYPRFKAWCDRYFYLPHRGEARGVGGVFFDDFDEGGFDNAFGLMRSVGDGFIDAYLPIVDRRRGTPYGERERQWQLYRRGRYVEFNLLHDRGTKFGIQSGGRAESILMSMPPLARWAYREAPAAGSEEARLLERFLQPRAWVE